MRKIMIIAVVLIGFVMLKPVFAGSGHFTHELKGNLKEIPIKQPAVVTFQLNMDKGHSKVVIDVYVDNNMIQTISIRNFIATCPAFHKCKTQPLTLKVGYGEAILMYDYQNHKYDVIKEFDYTFRRMDEHTIVMKFKVDEGRLLFDLVNPDGVQVVFRAGGDGNQDGEPVNPPKPVNPPVPPVQDDSQFVYPLPKMLNYAYIIYYPIIKYNDRQLAILNIPEMKYKAQIFIYNNKLDSKVVINSVTLQTIHGEYKIKANTPITLTKCDKYTLSCPTLKVEFELSIEHLYYTKDDLRKVRLMAVEQYKQFKKVYIQYRDYLRSRKVENVENYKMHLYSSYYNYLMFKYISKGYFMVLKVNATIDEKEYTLILPVPHYMYKYFRFITPQRVKMSN